MGLIILGMLLMGTIAFNVFVYPFYVSPLRYLPGPTVSKLALRFRIMLLTLITGQCLLSWTDCKVPSGSLVS
jgi:hypothetical protein